MPGKTGSKMTNHHLPMYFRKKPRGSTASGHKMGRAWSKKR